MSRVRRSWLGVLLVVCTAGLALSAARPPWWPAFVALAVIQGSLVAVLWRAGVVSMREVLLGAVLFRLFFLPLPPVLSDDGFRYVWDGFLQHQGINPYLYRPEAADLAAYHGHPVYDELNSAGFFSVYPPVSQLFFFVGGLFGGTGWLVSFYVIKVLFVAVEGVGVWLLSRLVAARSLMLYAWHPLVLVEVAGQGHTEAVMVGLLVVTVWAVRRDKPGWAAAALTAAGWVKLYPFVLLPLLWLRYGWKAVGPVVVVTVLVWAPYARLEAVVHLVESLRLYIQYFEYNAGLYLGLKQIFYGLQGSDISKTLGPLLQGVYLSFAGIIYLVGDRRAWPLTKSMIVLLGGFLVCATTMHPWYLLGVLALLPLRPGVAWHWHVLALGSLGTYLFYIDGSLVPFIVAGWGGWAVVGLRRHADGLLQEVQRYRARRKASLLKPALEVVQTAGPVRVLDLGAAEGYVGEALARHTGASVVLADVIDLNRTGLPHVRYDGCSLPFADKSFDVTVLAFVLHHAEAPERVIGEALRVTQHRICVLESVYETSRQRQLLMWLDRLANRLRSGGAMRAQEGHLYFRTADAWRSFFLRQGATVMDQRRLGSYLHRQAYYVLEPPEGIR